jgi:CIC family chloride channel protein
VFGGSSAAFVVVGMAAVFSGAGRVPIATLFMVTEMTGGYHLLPAAALVVTLSYLVQDTLTSHLKYKSLYGSQIPRRSSRDIDLLEGVLVGDAMTKDFESVPSTMSLKELAPLFEQTHHHGFPVVDDQGKLTGMVTLDDLHRAILEPTFETQTVADIATVDGLAVAYPEETMSVALWRMGVRKVGRLPVVDRQDTRRLVGLVRREDIIRAYEQAIATRKDTSARLRELREAYEGNVRVLEVDVSGQHPFVGKLVQEIAATLPRDCILVSIRRDKRVIIPHGDTTIQKGDHLVTLVGANCENEARQALLQRD